MEKWAQQACMTMFFLNLKDATSERPTALLPTLILCRSGCVRLGWSDGKKGIELVGMRLMGALEVQSVLLGRDAAPDGKI